MKKFIYFRCYSFRLNLPRGRVSPRRSTVPQRRTPTPPKDYYKRNTLSYYGIVDSEARARLIEPSSSVEPNILADDFVFEPPRLPEPVFSRVPRVPVGEVSPVEGIPGEPVAESSARVSEILPDPIAESSVVSGTPVSNTPITETLTLNGKPPHSPLPVIDLMAKKNDPDPGGGGSSGGGLSNGGFSGGNQGPNLVLYFFFLQILLFFLLWCFQWVLQKLRQILEEYRRVRERWSEIEKPPENTPMYKKWLEKDRFYKLTDLFLAGVTLALTPDLLGPVLRNITNRWSKAILKLIIPFVRLFFSCGFFLGGSIFSLKALSVLMNYFQPYYSALVRVVKTGSISNTPVFFLEAVLKCITAGFLAGIICRNFLKWKGQNKQETLLALGATGVSGIGIFLISQDTVLFMRIAIEFSKTEIGNFFLKSQLGRITLLLGCIRVLAALEELPYTTYFFVFFVCIFNVYFLAYTATPNLF